MRNSQNAIAALALVLVLSTPTFAGIMITEVAPPPPPPPAVTGVMVAEASDGIMEAGVTDTLTQIALSLVQAVTRL